MSDLDIGPDLLLFNTWVNKNYGGNTRTKTITREKYQKICKLIRGEDQNCNAKFRFWVRNKGFQIMKHNSVTNNITNDRNGDLYVSLHAKEVSKDQCYLCGEETNQGECSIENFLRTNLPAISFYRKVSVVDEFYEIIKNAHIDEKGSHAGQKKTYRLVSDTFAFLPREVITFYLLNCATCKPRIQKYGPVPKSRGKKRNAETRDDTNCNTNERNNAQMLIQKNTDQVIRPLPKRFHPSNTEQHYGKYDDIYKEEQPVVHILDDSGSLSQEKLDLINNNIVGKEMPKLQNNRKRQIDEAQTERTMYRRNAYLHPQYHCTKECCSNDTFSNYENAVKYKNAAIHRRATDEYYKQYVEPYKQVEYTYRSVDIPRITQDAMTSYYHRQNGNLIHATPRANHLNSPHSYLMSTAAQQHAENDLLHHTYNKHMHHRYQRNHSGSSGNDTHDSISIESQSPSRRDKFCWSNSPDDRQLQEQHKRLIPKDYAKKPLHSSGESSPRSPCVEYIANPIIENKKLVRSNSYSTSSYESLPTSPNEISIDRSVAEMHQMVFEQVKTTLQNLSQRNEGRLKVPTRASIVNLMRDYQEVVSDVTDVSDTEDEEITVS